MVCIKKTAMRHKRESERVMMMLFMVMMMFMSEMLDDVACNFIFFYHLPQRMRGRAKSGGRVEVDEQAKAKDLMNPQAAQELYGSHATRSHVFRFWTA